MNAFTRAKINKIAEDLAKEKYTINGIERLFILSVLFVSSLFVTIYFIIYLLR